VQSERGAASLDAFPLIGFSPIVFLLATPTNPGLLTRAPLRRPRRRTVERA